jgi:concentrative nucleoside transporter, CNT family
MALVHGHESPYVSRSNSVVVAQRDLEPVKRASTESFTNEKRSANPDEPGVLVPITDEEADRDQRRHELYTRFRPYILTGVAMVILGWWISATILKATRHRWYVTVIEIFLS